jgi:hypothetical protein
VLVSLTRVTSTGAGVMTIVRRCTVTLPALSRTVTVTR